MTLLESILKWSEEKLPLWQRDAVRRLFQFKNLSEQDYEELYCLMKADHKLPNPSLLMAKPLTGHHLPAILHPGEMITLKTIRDLKNVNCIAEGQCLEFSNTGMTVIYGGNGSGKSGYTRVLKHACRARGQKEDIYPNANKPPTKDSIPEATIEIELNGNHKIYKWSHNSEPPQELSAIAVFDSQCARAYITSELEVAFLPYGLDVVENLANVVLSKLSSMLDKEIKSIIIDLKPFDHLRGETKVGDIISSLSDKSDQQKIKILGTLTIAEEGRIKDLEKVLSEADPGAKAKELRRLVERIRTLQGKLNAACEAVGDSAIRAIQSLDYEAVTTAKAEKSAADMLKSGEVLLPGTGERTWKLFFEAARKYSQDIAYPNLPFPNVSEGAVCPLCQQMVSGARERMKRFDEYIKSDVSQLAKQKRESVEQSKLKIEKANFDLFLDKAMAEELSLLDTHIVSIITLFQEQLKQRQKYILASLVSHDWQNWPEPLTDPCTKLDILSTSQIETAETLEKASEDAHRDQMIIEQKELRARQGLSMCLSSVIVLIDRMKVVSLLESCRKSLKTTNISTQSKTFANTAITEMLKNSLDKEFASLEIGHIKTKLKDRIDKGKIKHQLLLDLPSTNNLEKILSEGEQRAIAIGSFLAELELANHRGAIVFDDPVSSLDHKRRKRVALRLATESAKRQVIIFTHDVNFLQQLRESCERSNIHQLFYFLEPNIGCFGYINQGLPWDKQSWKDRIDFLEKAQRKLKNTPWPPDPPEALAREIIREYSFLRATIERVVQDLVLSGTIRRFSDYIQVKNLEHVVGLQKAEVDEICRIYQRCHDVVEAHDPALEKDATPPHPDELKKDIEDLKLLIGSIKIRRKRLSP
jgi:energy-coupling factor transporter ATP-binding protein EcfA2